MVFGAFLSLLPLPEKFRQGGLTQSRFFQGSLPGGLKAAAVQGVVLAGAPGAHNTFAAPETVAPRALNATLTADGFTAVLPPCSVAGFTVTPA